MRNFSPAQKNYMMARALLDAANDAARPEFDAIDQTAADDVVSAECERIDRKYQLTECGRLLREAEIGLFKWAWQTVKDLPQYKGSPVGGMFEAIIAGRGAQFRPQLVNICMRAVSA